MAIFFIVISVILKRENCIKDHLVSLYINSSVSFLLFKQTYFVMSVVGFSFVSNQYIVDHHSVSN